MTLVARGAIRCADSPGERAGWVARSTIAVGGVVALFLIPCTGAWSAERVQFGQGGQITWTGQVVGDVDGIDEIGTTAAEYRSDLTSSGLAVPPGRQLYAAPGGDLVDIDSEEYPEALLPHRVLEEENLATTSPSRGGGIYSPNGFAGGVDDSIYPGLISDNETISTAFRIDGKFGIFLDTDLGARAAVSRMIFFPRNTLYPLPSTPFENDFLRDFQLFVNDGQTLNSSGGPEWGLPHHQRTDNGEAIVVIDVDPPRFIRHIRLKNTSTIPFEIHKFQVFGDGFFADAHYISPVINLNKLFNWGQLRWVQQIVGDALISDMQIRTRAGVDDSPFVFTRRRVGVPDARENETSLNNPGEPLLRAEYLRLPEEGGDSDAWERGSFRDDSENWSPWTAPYDPVAGASEAGTPVLSPGPRQFFQFSVDFQTSNPEASHVLRNLSVEVSPALAAELVAEIFPRQVRPAEDIPFVYAVRADMRADDVRGFDHFEMRTPNRVLKIERIEIIDAAEQHIVDHTFLVQDGVTVEEILSGTAAQDSVAITALSREGFTLQFPRVFEHDALFKIHFVDRVLTYSSTYNGRALLRGSADVEEESFQGVVEGNAGNLGPDDRAYPTGTTVLSPSVAETGLIGSFELGAAFTPNDDDVNDTMALRFDVLTVVGEADISVDVFDLSGRRHARLLAHNGANGTYDLAWDGRNEHGNLVPSGVYLIRIEVDGDARSSTAVRSVGIVY